MASSIIEKSLAYDIALHTDTIPLENIDSKITVSANYLRKHTGIAEIEFEGTANEDIPSWTQLVTELPTGWRPYQSNGSYTINIAGNTYAGNMNAAGVINTAHAISSGQLIRFHAIYFIAS